MKGFLVHAFLLKKQPIQLIPLPTLYYFLCYAWNRLPEPAVLLASEAAPFERPLGLLAQVLLHATRRLLRNGLPRTFQTQ